MIELSKTQLAALKLAEGRALSIPVQTRLRAVRLAAYGYDLEAIADILQCHPRKIGEWIKTYEELGLKGLRDFEGHGVYSTRPHDTIGEGLYILFCDGMPVASIFQRRLAQLVVQLLNAD